MTDVGRAEEDRCEINRLAYEQGLKGLESQDSTLSSIRQSGAVIAALNGLCAAFLGKQALESSATCLEKETMDDKKGRINPVFGGITPGRGSSREREDEEQSSKDDYKNPGQTQQRIQNPGNTKQPKNEIFKNPGRLSK